MTPKMEQTMLNSGAWRGAKAGVYRGFRRLSPVGGASVKGQTATIRSWFRGRPHGNHAEHQMARPRAVVAAILGILTLADMTPGSVAPAAAAPAQGVPLPTPAPQRGPARPSAPLTLDPGAQRSGTGQQGAGPVIAIPRLPSFLRPGETTAFDAKQRALVEKVNAYLANTRVLSGNFVQVGPDGGKSEGEFYIQKPGKVRFDYDPPSPIELIADGSSVVVRDRKLATQDLYPLSQTPLRFLLSDRVDLMRDTNLIAVSADDVFVTIVIEERQIIAGTHRLMLMFSAQDFQLKQWTVTDPQGYDTTVAIYNLNTSARPDPNMFRIDYTRDVK
jgi:outer membrane lipoprotein-sorting protein